MELKLPILLASRQDITHAHRELRNFDDKVMQSVMRHDNPVKYPGISATLRAIAQENQIDLTKDAARKQLLIDLEKLQKTAPSVHISFPSDPSPEVLQRIVTWLRKEVDPRIVIRVGLQPTIAAGIVMRTPNHQFDFSLRRHLYNHRDDLRKVLTNGQ
jgi:F0F1-type ATP synthase delta subunit